MAPRSLDRLDFYKKNRDYSRLLDEDGALEDEEEEEAVEDDDKSGRYRKSEPDEDPKAKRERQEYIERREKLKELERQKLKQKFAGVYGRKTNSTKHDNGNQNSRFGENISDKDKKKMLQYDDYGSFFGPSQPAIARRVIEETRARLEAAHVTAKVLRDAPSTKKISVPASDAKSEYKKTPVIVNEAKKKAQRLKEARDYSFLFSEDAEMPGYARGPSETRNVASSRPDNSLPKQVIPKNSMALRKPTPTSKPISHAKEVKNMILSARQMPTKVDTQKVSPSLNVKTSVDSKKQLLKVASGSGRSAQETGLVRHSVTNSKVALSISRKKETPTISGIKVGKDVHQQSSVSRPPSVQKTLPLKTPMHKAHTEQRNPLALPKSPPPKPALKPAPKPAPKPTPKPAPKPALKPAPRPAPKPTLISAPKPAPRPAPRPALMSAPKAAPKPIPKMAPKPQARPVSRDSRHEDSKKRRRDYDSDEDLDGGGNYSSIIRQLFRYDPNKYKDIDDQDDSDMEVGFSRIQAEERRSERIAREEDERELALIEAEEREERARAKKRKLKHSQG